MAILGLTDNREAFPIIGVLRKGEAKDPDKNAPGKDLTYFRFVTDDELATEMFHKAYPDQEALRNINIFLPYKTAQENLIDGCWIEKWIASSLVYRSDGETLVMWRTSKGALSTEPKPDPKPEILEDGKRADGSMQVGRLSAIIPELGRFVTVTILTTSKWDIINLSRQLRAYESLKGDLRGIPFIIQRRKQMVSTPAGKGKRARREKWLLSIEMSPEYSMKQLSAQEQAALPAGGNIIDTSDYTVHELPSGLFNPAEERAIMGLEEPPAAEPQRQAEAKSNGKAEKLQRPLTAIQVRDGLRRRIEGDDNSPATKAQVGLVAGKLEEAFAPDKDAKGKRLTVLHWLWNIESAKELTFKQAKVTLDWLLSGQTDSGGDHSLHPSASEEAQRIYHEAMLAAEQVEMPLEETEEGQLGLFEEEELDKLFPGVPGGVYQD